ncbi:MAG: molybdate ABC transporter substrate-binding protein [Marinospirillum sp.]|uniref:molybdate ABC transporter substrate-binding protein n=1 Tax=Marinospirillum sp. TaxID=2183934 RepID=UPI001A0DD23D|nr:molybdate ABC transporter substrate-binding protein [Marinospirillum sp.]MBE0507985.1 molybdate ABC transporter substrate-binding protein [Marinospirillum sp.]
MKRLSAGLLLAGWLFSGVLLAETLVVYSGAGLRPAVQPLLDAFEQQTGTQVRVEYAGMGQLMARYETTGRGDVFISGTHFYTDRLQAAGKMTEAHDLGYHTAVIGVHPSRAADIRHFDDLARPGVRLALGDPQSMALGRTAEAILDASKLGDAIRANVVVRGTTVQQLALYAAQGEVDAALIGRTAALQQGEKLRMVDIPLSIYEPERITLGALVSSQQPALAQQLIDFIRSPIGRQQFEKVGYILPEHRITP